MEYADCELDARGLNCPYHILSTKKSMQKIATGQVLYVIATDPSSVKDFKALCSISGNEMLASREENGEYFFWLKKNQ
ncbi:hypothetical protein MNBD_GAMMA12-1745 [hydrothermal vent metagenome]|uniref:UPF0033 domain-containing protein n=1 Tax=hydrothermal vent metagenome TaxID=652676 RepID=A0A3B0YV64_9ZZZZ